VLDAQNLRKLVEADSRDSYNSIVFASFGWCGGSSDPTNNLETWSFSARSTQYEFDYQIAYCLSEPQPEKCRLQFSLPLAIIVVFFNVAKALCMFSMIYRLDEKVDKSPIMNIGDIVSS